MMNSGPNQSVSSPSGRELAELVDVLRRSHGIDVSVYEEAFLAKSFARFLAIAGFDAYENCLLRLSEDPEAAAAFVRSLRVTYSEFFRNPLAFALLEQLVLPSLLEAKEQDGRTEIRVWSAGCAAGQEAWSVAIMLDELLGPRDKTLSYRIFATDLSEPELAQARDGVYSAAALGNVSLRRLAGCFLRQDEFYAIAPRIRERVAFSPYDLVDECTTCPAASIYGEFDLVLCSNVLLYYRSQTQHFILDKLRRGLASGGYLMTGESERAIVEDAGGFHAVAPPATIFRMSARWR